MRKAQVLIDFRLNGLFLLKRSSKLTQKSSLSDSHFFRICLYRDLKTQQKPTVLSNSLAQVSLYPFFQSPCFQFKG